MNAQCNRCAFVATPENSRDVGIIRALYEHHEAGHLVVTEPVFDPTKPQPQAPRRGRKITTVRRSIRHSIPPRAEPRPCPRCKALMRSDAEFLWCEECAWVEAA